MLSDIICFFGFLIFLELIELRCKGLNLELKKNIIERSSKECNLETRDDKTKIIFYDDFEIIEQIELENKNDINLY